ncbi:O-methyltransferase [Streptomyces naganishii]|uniref:O-methyltransferase n=1 Tax=Streptomyces naganishii JCM 4654 TaxID=1306179 RepID=A0A919CWU0_9ACTN|nr:O-methyltransferase [Streptomyces naganishii]GHD92899.1 O-methyltransferase [Streptomyces naganishii JCM 4654]
MERELARILAELEEFGEANDRAAADRGHKMLNITHDTGVLLTLLLRNGRCREVLEVGTSNGYSTLWLAHAVGPGGRVTTVEHSPHKREMAAENFRRAGLAPRIRQVAGEAGEFLASCGAGAFDFVFLDSDRGQYADWWPALQRILAPGCLLVVDNAVSHAHELKDFVQRVEASEGYLSSLLPVGKGEFVVLKAT